MVWYWTHPCCDDTDDCGWLSRFGSVGVCDGEAAHHNEGKAMERRYRWICRALVWTCIGVIGGTLFLVSVARAASEAEYTAEWCGRHGLTYDVPGDGNVPDALKLETITGRTVYADCVDKNTIVEVDFASKFMEGIGQTLFYGRLARLDPILLLIIKDQSDCKYFRDAGWLIFESNQRIQLYTTGQTCRE